jgi:hypothetical protein
VAPTLLTTSITMRKNKMSFARVAIGSLAAVSLSAGVAAAEDELYAGRDGATFGVGVGGGTIGCSDSDGNDCGGSGDLDAAGVSFRAGFMLNPNLALTGDLWAMGRTEDDRTVSQGIATATLRGWVAPSVWLQGGLGVARSAAEIDIGDGAIELMSETDYVPAATAGIGVELISTDALALDLELKAGTGLYEDDIQIYNMSHGAGVSFY